MDIWRVVSANETFEGITSGITTRLFERNPDCTRGEMFFEEGAQILVKETEMA
jgi:hypothetical protein